MYRTRNPVLRFPHSFWNITKLDFWKFRLLRIHLFRSVGGKPVLRKFLKNLDHNSNHSFAVGFYGHQSAKGNNNHGQHRRYGLLHISENLIGSWSTTLFLYEFPHLTFKRLGVNNGEEFFSRRKGFKANITSLGCVLKQHFICNFHTVIPPVLLKFVSVSSWLAELSYAHFPVT